MSHQGNDQNSEKLVVLKDEEKILLDHDYDGIRELDNPLPKWWLYTFYITIIFAVPYYLAYTFFDAKPINKAFEEDVARVTKIQKAAEDKKGSFKLEEFNKVAADPKLMKKAKKIYKRKCKACHGKVGQGGVGPNLTDKYWLHGKGTREDIYNIINKGVVEKGMPAWGAKLGKEKTLAVLKYIEKFQGTNPPDGKEPQGKEY